MDLAPSSLKLAENTLDSARIIDTNATFCYELSTTRETNMYASIDYVVNGIDETSRPASAAISPDPEVHFRPQTMSSMHCWKPITGTDIDDNRSTMHGRHARSHTDRRPVDAPATPGAATPTQRDADPSSVTTAFMTLHSNYAGPQRATNGNPWRPTASDIGSNTRHGLGHQPPTAPAAPSATAVPTAGAAPIFGIVASDSDLLPPCFNGARRVDADDWAQDFCDYVALRRISLTHAALLFRTRLTCAARTWLEGVPPTHHSRTQLRVFESVLAPAGVSETHAAQNS